MRYRINNADQRTQRLQLEDNVTTNKETKSKASHIIFCGVLKSLEPFNTETEMETCKQFVEIE